MKRLVVVGLLMLLVLGAVGVTEAASLPFKVGLVTGTVSQGEEEYRAAEKMAAKYPGSVIHVTYPDNFMQEQETTMAQIIRLGMDPEVKAIDGGAENYSHERAYCQKRSAGQRVYTDFRDPGFVG